jgi:hypothetical protein
MSDQVPEIDTTKPHPARVYDYFIGGKNNFSADRETAAKVLAKSPNARIQARENRAFLGRAVRFLAAEAGVRQFLDIGTGLPTTGNVHEVAQSVQPSSRIVYTDNDPLVLVHARALLTSAPEGRTAYLQGDVREPEAILTAPATGDLIDPALPGRRGQAGRHRRDARRCAAAGELCRRLAPDHGTRPGADGGWAGGDAGRRHDDAEA